jgi:uncharacterized protein YdhG (YjbR/CyaY superfamily)
MKDTRKSTKRTTRGEEGLSDAELAALKETLQERKAQSRRGAAKADGEADVLAKIAAMPAPDRDIARRLHALVKANAPNLSPKTWYGMPAYANKDGKVVCFFTPASKFKTRYASFGFNEDAKLDDGDMWATAFALKKLTTDDEAKLAALVKKAVRN